MTDDLVPVTGRSGPLRVDVSPGVVPVMSGSDAFITVELTNNDSVIRSLNVSVLGLDDEWVRIPEQNIALFPAERRSITITCTLPEEFPSGARRAAIEVRESLGDLVPTLVEFDLLVDPIEQFSLHLDPTTVIVGRRAAFTAVVRNNGNTTLEVELAATDPELILTSTFIPPTVLVYPNTSGVARLETEGKRPWFGAPQVRVLTVTATSGPTVTQATAAVMQRPIISRRLLTLLGLLTAITVFTLVLAATFGNVARRANANAELIKQSLGGNEPASSGAAPAQMGGLITSSTGQQLSGVTIELFDVAKGPSVAVATTVTDAVGGFNFAAVSAGTYRVRFSAAGFGDVWFPAAASFEQAEDVVVEAGAAATVDAQLIGQPASVSGVVQGPDVVGATVLARIPGANLPPVPGAPLPTSGTADGPVVVTVAVDAAGRFTIPGLPTPSDFELVVVKSGYTSEVRPIFLTPGQQLDDIVLALVKGDGRVTGTVVDSSGSPVGGAVVNATDGANETSTVTVSSGAQAGTFELRDLITPATYSLSVVAPGFVTQNITVRLDSAQSVPALTISLQPSVGAVGGFVFKAGPPNTPFGGATVTVTGPDFTRTTTSLTVEPVGSWKITGLPLPGTYTVAFSSPGYVTEARGVELSSNVPSNDTTTATLTTGLASVGGSVVETGGGTAPGVTVTVTGQGITRITRTAVSPAGTFGLAGLPPGAYSFTFERSGSRDVVVARNLVAGPNTIGETPIEKAAGIYGTVTVGGSGVAGAVIKIYIQAEYPLNPIEATTLAGGTYAKLIDIEAEELYIVELYIDGFLVTSQQPVAVGPGSPAVGIDFVL